MKTYMSNKNNMSHLSSSIHVNRSHVAAWQACATCEVVDESILFIKSMLYLNI